MNDPEQPQHPLAPQPDPDASLDAGPVADSAPSPVTAPIPEPDEEPTAATGVKAHTAEPAVAGDGANEPPAARTTSGADPDGPSETPHAITDSLNPLLRKEPIWSPDDYRDSGNFGGSAGKLSSSFVAPLVAAARGYRTFDRDNLDAAFKDFGIQRGTKQGRRLVDAIIRSDVLLMPWHRVDKVGEPGAAAKTLAPSAIQYRPSDFSAYSEEERERKYEFIIGSGTPIGAHPSTPDNWVDEAPTVLIAEGLLKADAALTGWLLSKGITRAELSDTTGDPRLRLNRLMAAIPASEALLITSIAGVWNWGKNPEWKSLAFNRERDVWLGIDGDIATNPYVWRAATEFADFLRTNRDAKKVYLLSPQVTVEGENGAVDDEKIGIDDYLADHGDWSSLVSGLTDQFPERPPVETAADGTLRVDDDGCGVSQYKVTERRADGVATGGFWEPVVPLGGRIAATIAERVPSTAEIRTGEFGAHDVDHTQTDWEAEVEVTFRNPAGEVETHTIVAPARILNYPPEQWESKGADIPAPIMIHPKWPPRGKFGEAWMEAIKGNQPDKIAQRTRWATMGWVPVPGAIPAFIAGKTVIGGHDSLDENVEVLPGVTAETLDRAHAFGVGDTNEATFDDPDYVEQVRNDIESLLRTYVVSGAWTDRRNAAVVVAAGLRPALPLQKRALPYFTGARGTGKTFSAEAVMAFWQNSPGSLIPIPGSAKDTAAHMELSLARSVIWCIDDLAPASSRRQSEDEKDKIGNLIRMYFNGTARGRSNASMGNRKKNLPRALLLITAENEPTVSSERDRVILCDIGYGALSASREPTNRIVAMNQTSQPGSLAPARVAQAMVKFLRWRASRPNSSWSQVYDDIVSTYITCVDNAAKSMKKIGADGTKRHHETAADLTVALAYLERLAVHVGCDDWVLELLDGPDSLIEDVSSLVAEGHRDNKGTSPGRALVEALSASLRRGAAYVEPIDSPGSPPMPENEIICASLGWVRTPDGLGWRPAQGATRVGWLAKKRRANGVEDNVVLFDPKTAFQVAQERYPELLPHGQQERSSWAAVTGEGLGEVDLLRVQGTRRLNSARVHTNGVQRSGYPISLEQVLRGGQTEKEAAHHAALPYLVSVTDEVEKDG